MSNHQITFIGWILFVISALGFCIASIGSFWAMFGSVFFLVACLVFMIPFFRNDP
ncbi:cytochrome oxidase subunit III [Tateyamaria sp.]|uniref:cytochrome oxidase subunit III n=1 Tax=Tateyamaria sp. TaxID=1929288 RepID=UPI00329D51E3